MFNFIVICLIIYSLLVYKIINDHIFFYLKFHNSFTEEEKQKYKYYYRKDIQNFNKFSIYIRAFFLVPIRFSLYLIILILAYSSLKLVSLIFSYKIKNYEEELPKTYTLINQMIINFFSKIYFFICGIKFEYEVIKTNKTTPIEEREKAKIFVANHTSWLDIQYFFSFNPNPSMMVYHHAKNKNFYGFFCDITQNIYVNRGELGKKNDNKKEVFKKLDRRFDNFKKGKNFNPLLVFPEGTTCNYEYILPFKKGAFTAGLPVRMFILNYKNNDIVPEYTLFDEIGVFTLIFSNLTNNIKVKEIDFLLYPEKYMDDKGIIDSSKMAEDCRKIIAEKGGLKLFDLKDNYTTIKEYVNFQKERFSQLKNNN